MLINYKKIGDTLTDSELNAYASLIAHNKVLKDSFKLKNGVITGNYGKYTFDLTNASIVDNGILITDETLSNNITVKLSNATQYATYTLHFTVVRYGDVNILDETNDNIETFDLTLDLIDGETVNIPLDTLQEYDVILFNSNITIKHDKPEIIGKYITALDITGDKSIIQTSETSTLEITATDLETLPMPNKEIQLLKNNTLLDTLTTDNQGKCSYVYTGVGDGLLNFIAKYRGLQSEIFDLWDTLFHDEGTVDNTSQYTLESCTLTFDTDHYVLTRLGDTGSYIRYNGTIADFKGKTIKFECEIDSPANVHLRIYQTVNGTTTNTIGTADTSGVISVTADIDDTATAINFRVVANSLSANQTFTIKNIKVYSV